MGVSHNRKESNEAVATVKRWKSPLRRVIDEDKRR